MTQKKRKNLYGGDNDECGICLETWDVRPNISTCYHITSPQNTVIHKFHSECLNNWYERKRTCPLCNTGEDITWINEARGDGVGCPGDITILQRIKEIWRSLSDDNKFMLIFIIILWYYKILFMIQGRPGNDNVGGNDYGGDVF